MSRANRAHPVSLTRWVAWAVLTPFAVWVALGLIGADRFSPFAQLGSFTPYVAALGTLPLGLALALRQWPAAVLGALVAAALVVNVLPRALVGDGERMETVAEVVGPPSLRVLTVNTLAGSVDVKAVTDLVRRERPDVVSVAELPPRTMAAFSGAGLDRLLPYRVVRPAPGAQGTGLYSRLPLTDAGEVSDRTTFAQARATAVVGGRLVDLIAVHPAAPRPGDVDKWRRDLSELPAASCTGPVRILAGDFNATLDHRMLRRLLDNGYVDAADAVGAGLRRTWPADRPAVPGLQIDHVLVDQRLAVRAVRMYDLPGTDHRALLAELSLRAG